MIEVLGYSQRTITAIMKNEQLGGHEIEFDSKDHLSTLQIFAETSGDMCSVDSDDDNHYGAHVGAQVCAMHIDTDFTKLFIKTSLGVLVFQVVPQDWHDEIPRITVTNSSQIVD